jgi:hypothetical protein
MNKELKDNYYPIPDSILEKIERMIEKFGDKNIIGTERARNLVNTRKISYSLLKKIIHDLSYMDKLKENIRYHLNGGDEMLTWGRNFLNGERNLVKNIKKGRQRANNYIVGRKNAFIQNHSKDDFKKAPVFDFIKSNSDKSSASSITVDKIFEEIEKIKNYLK